ncbi:MAG: hypothetical protein ACTHLK_03490, partial [Brucella intermedia]
FGQARRSRCRTRQDAARHKRKACDAAILTTDKPPAWGGFSFGGSAESFEIIHRAKRKLTIH